MPVHDVASYVVRSLDSVLAQPGVELDVVVVDDGSTDGSGDLVEEYARHHPEVRLLRQANAGVSAARNAALEHCRGEFVTFVDPDDFLRAAARADGAQAGCEYAVAFRRYSV